MLCVCLTFFKVASASNNFDFCSRGFSIQNAVINTLKKPCDEITRKDLDGLSEIKFFNDKKVCIGNNDLSGFNNLKTLKIEYSAVTLYPGVMKSLPPVSIDIFKSTVQSFSIPDYDEACKSSSAPTNPPSAPTLTYQDLVGTYYAGLGEWDTGNLKLSDKGTFELTLRYIEPSNPHIREQRTGLVKFKIQSNGIPVIELSDSSGWKKILNYDSKNQYLESQEYGQKIQWQRRP